MLDTLPLAPPTTTPLFRPKVPPPLTQPLGLFAFLKKVRENPIATWMDAHFEEFVVAGETAMGRITVVSDPALVRYLLVERAAYYRKDDLQKRVLAPGLGDGLLTAEGDEWRLQRRTLAPIFPRAMWRASSRRWMPPARGSAGGWPGATVPRSMSPWR